MTGVLGLALVVVFFGGMFVGLRSLFRRPGERIRGGLTLAATIVISSALAGLYAERQASDRGFESAAAMRLHDNTEKKKLSDAEQATRDRAAAEKVAKKEADEAKAREHGHHCLSAWDGSHRAFKEVVKEQLRDPASFEHIRTVTAKKVNDSHIIQMKYRARNGFGGMNVATAVGLFDADDCKAVLVGIE